MAAGTHHLPVMQKRKRPAQLPRLLAGAFAVFLTWQLSMRLRSQTRSTADPSCPLVYQRVTVDDIRTHKFKPYLLGEQQQPSCTNCHRTGGWADICQFKGGQLCGAWLQQPIIDAWLARSHDLALTLTPCDLWKFLRGRTLWMLGDSQMLDFFKATQCFMFEFWPDLQHSNVTDDVQLQQELSQLLPAVCAAFIQGTRVCYIRVDKGNDNYERVLPLLAGSVPTGLVSPERDWMVVNFGLHHWQDYEEKLAAFAEYYDKHTSVLPRMLWQPTPPQHFANGEGSGEYPGGDPPFECGPIANFTVTGDGLLQLEEGKVDSFDILHGGWRNAAAEPFLRRAGIPMLPSYNESFWMHAYHRDNGAGMECTHFCHPSAPQVWVLALYRALRDLQHPADAVAGTAQQQL